MKSCGKVVPQDNDEALSMGYLVEMRSHRRIFLREWREFREKTQVQLADAIGVTKTHVSNIENGKRQYTQELLEAAALYLQTEPALILNVDPNAPSGAWSLMEVLGRIPENKHADARRIMEALADPPSEQKAEPAPPPRIRRRRTKAQ